MKSASTRGGRENRRSAELPALSPLDLVGSQGWRSPWCGNLILQAELQLRAAPESVLQLAAKLDEADLYPGAVDLLVATACPKLAPAMHRFYGGCGNPMVEALGARRIARVDREAQRLVGRLTLAALRVELRCMNDPMLHRPNVIRDVLGELGLRVAPAHPEKLPRIAPVTDVPADDPRPFFRLRSGEILDRRSGLVWRDTQFAFTGSWAEARDIALIRCLQSDEDMDDWRLPSREDLGTLRGTWGLPNDWVWLSDSSRSKNRAWCARISGERREVRATWRLKVWLVRPLGFDELTRSDLQGGSPLATAAE